MLTRFNKIDRVIRVYDGTKYLVLFESKKYDSIYNRIRYLLSVKSDITYAISHNYLKIKVGLKWFFTSKKAMTVYNVLILITTVNICIKYKCYIMREMMFLKELILMKQVHQKSVIFVIIGIFFKKGLTFKHMHAIDAMIY